MSGEPKNKAESRTGGRKRAAIMIRLAATREGSTVGLTVGNRTELKGLIDQKIAEWERMIGKFQMVKATGSASHIAMILDFEKDLNEIRKAVEDEAN